MSEIEANLDGVDLIVTTMRIKKDFGKPYVNGMPFLSGIGVEKTEQKILDVLKHRRIHFARNRLCSCKAGFL